MAIFPPEQYKFDAIYVLNNGYYIEFKQNGPEHQAITKTPEGAVFSEGDSSFASPPNILVEEAIVNLSSTLGDIDVSIQEIIQKQTPPPPPKNIQFKIQGRIVNKDGDPITRAKITPNLFGFPPQPPSLPNANSPLVGETPNLLPEVFIVPPINVDDAGYFTYHYEGGVEIDFGTSFVSIEADAFFPKTIGPTLTKTGEETLTRGSKAAPFTGSTSVVDTQLFQQENGNYRSTITLKNNSTGETSTGEGISPNREIAKKIARSKAEQGFAQVNDDEETLIVDIYDIGRITLQPTELNLEKEEAVIQQQVQRIENLEIEIAGKINLPFEVKLTNIFNKQKENLKRTLFPAILVIIAKFGPNIVHSILSGKIKPLDDKVCPPKEEIELAIRKRNELVRQLNNIYKTVRTVAKVLNVTNALIIGLKIGLKLGQILTAIPTTPFTPFGLKPFYSGLTESTFKTIEKRLEIAGIAVTILTIVAATIGATLAAIINLLNSLDFLIQECSEEIDPETGQPKIPFIQINDELNNFIDPSTGEPEDVIDPLTGNPYPYKGFTFEIKQDTSQNFQYPKRFAIARNIQGIQMLRSESSFASNPGILIEELKFIIDRDNLRAD